MDNRARYFAIALSLTLLEAFVTLHYGWAARTCGCQDTSSRGLLLMRAMAAISPVNLRTQAIRPSLSPGGERYV